MATFERTRHRAVGERLEGAETGCGQITRDAAHAQAIAPVRRDRDVDDRVIQAHDVDGGLPIGVCSVRSTMPSCSSEMPISRSDSSMPLDVTPRISVGFKVMPVPGMIRAAGRKHADHAGARVRCAADQLDGFAVAGIDRADAQAVRVWVLVWLRSTLAVTNVSNLGAIFNAFKSPSPTMVSVSVISVNDADGSKMLFEPAQA